MDLTKYRAKLIGSEEERAVSPVIGVILMVAITVILAAVIAAFVLDLGDDMGESSVNAGVSADVSDTDNEVTVTVDDMGDAEEFVLRGEGVDGDVELNKLENTGDTMTLAHTPELNSNSGDANIIAVAGDSESNVGGFEWDWNSDVTVDIDEDDEEVTVTLDYLADKSDSVDISGTTNGTAESDSIGSEGDTYTSGADTGDIEITDVDGSVIEEVEWDFTDS